MTALRILAIDGAGPVAAAAFLADRGGGRFLAQVAREASGDADLLPAKVGACLAAAGWRAFDLDVIACAVGPGGFTSIRVTVALARGLALAARCPVLAVTSFQAIAFRAHREGMAGPLRVVVPGGRGNWFVQDIDGSGEVTGQPAMLLELPSPEDDRPIVGPGDGGFDADATDVAAVAAARLANGERAMAGTQLVPLYLRGADARVGAGRSLLVPAGR